MYSKFQIKILFSTKCKLFKLALFFFNFRDLFKNRYKNIFKKLHLENKLAIVQNTNYYNFLLLLRTVSY